MSSESRFPRHSRHRSSFRLGTALLAGRTAALASRLTGRGSGASIRGRVTTTLDPKAFAELIASRRIAAVTGTNGKTTTTHLLTAAIRNGLGDDGSQVITNADGANLHYGIVSTLGRSLHAPVAILETDERVVADTVRLGHPEILVLLNFSREQSDHNHEMAFLGRDWRAALAAAGPDGPMVIASSADPLIVWVCQRARAVVWVDTNPRWTADSTLCPNCGGVLIRETARWHCPDCPLSQPEADWWVDGDEAVSRKGDRHRLDLQLPGHFNLTNATCALAAAVEIGVSPDDALAGMRTVASPAGRYATATVSGTTVQLLLANNPASWTECLPLAVSDPLVLAIDAAAGDGRDLSWLWDVDFGELTGRTVICSGPRALDLAVRLDYSGIDHVVIEDLEEALDSPLLDGHWDAGHPIDVLSSSTPFQKLRQLGGLA